MGKSETRSLTLWQRLIRWDWVVLGLILPLILAINPGRSPVLLLLPLLWLGRWLATRHFVVPTPLDWSLFGLLLMVLVSQYATFDMAFSLPKIAGLSYGIVLFYGVVAFAGRTRGHLQWATSGLLLTGWGIAGLSLVTTNWTREIGPLTAVVNRLPARLLELPGTAAVGVNSNQVAGTLLWIVPLALVITWRQRRRWLALFAGITALFLTALLLLTQSRGGYLGLAAALAFVLLVLVWRWRRSVAVGLALTAVIAAAALLFAGREQLTFWLGSAMGGAVSSDFTTVGIDGRLEIWSRAIYGLQDFPFTGMGMNNFRRVVHILYPLFLVSPETDIAHAHNHLLQAGLDLGLPGLVAYLGVWLGTVVMLWQTWLHSRDGTMRAFVLGAAASLLAYFVYGLFDTVALGARPGFIFWWLLGLVAAAHRLVVVPPIRISG